MNSTYIMRQPILNQNQKVVAYEVVYRQDASACYNQQDEHIAQAIISFFHTSDEANLLNGKDAFLTFTPSFFMNETPFLFDKEKLVIQVIGSTLLHPNSRQKLLEYKKNGFTLVLLDFEFNRFFMDILPIFDILKIDFSSTDDRNIRSQIDLVKRLGLKVCAYHINDIHAKEKALAYQCDYYQGNSIAEIVRSTAPKIEHLQSNFFRLTSAISNPTPDFNEIAEIISLDITLTFSLLRIVNSAYFGLPNRIKDIKQALTILGINQLQHWIYLLSFSPDGGLADELIKTSFLRATLCQKLSRLIPELPLSSSEAYLLGMFSILDVLLEVPMSNVITPLPIDDAIKEALIEGTGICGDLLNLCVAYEVGNWTATDALIIALKLDATVIATHYIEALHYVNKTWGSLSNASEA